MSAAAWTRITITDLRSSSARSAAYLAQHRGLAVEVWRTPECAEVVVARYAAGFSVHVVQRNGMEADGLSWEGETPPETVVRMMRQRPKMKRSA